MGISIGICEMEAPNALCRNLRKDMVKVRVDDVSGFEDIAGHDQIVSLEDARSLVGDWEAFMKRNRISDDTDAIYMDKLKVEDDIKTLGKKAKDICTGWVTLSNVDPKRKDAVISASKKENRLTGWDMLSFDEMNEMCSKCTLSWDKGRGCIGAFGPDESLLPGIAEKYKCEIVASVPKGAKSGRIYDSKDGAKLAKEIEILKEALPVEGKMMVRRYSGPLERLEAVSKISVSEGCGFYFF
jgi:hypothetical protein